MPGDPIVVLGTGRCGSTVLARVLGCHDKLVTLGEFLSSAYPCGWGPEDVLKPSTFSTSCRTPRPAPTLLYRHGLEPNEFTYAVDGDRPYDRNAGVPPLLVTTLPSLLAAPEAGFEAVLAAIDGHPDHTLAGHLRSLADSVAELAGGGRRIVEQSGGSLLYVDLVRATFPDARIVHLVRSGIDCALSMSRHPSFRLAYVQGELAAAARKDPLRWVPSSATELEAGFVERYGPLSAVSLQRQGAPLAWFARTWSTLLLGAAEGLAGAEVLHVSYEDLVQKPRPTLTRIAAFVGIDPEPSWLDPAVAELHAGRVDAAARLDERDRRILAVNCRPGDRAAGVLLTQDAWREVGA